MQKLQLVCIRHTFCTRLCEKEMNVASMWVIIKKKGGILDDLRLCKAIVK